MEKLASRTGFLVPLAVVIASFAALDRWLMANGLEGHLEMGRSFVWLATVLAGTVLGCGFWRLKSARRP